MIGRPEGLKISFLSFLGNLDNSSDRRKPTPKVPEIQINLDSFHDAIYCCFSPKFDIINKLYA
jgi:hypothetical protein